MFTALAISPAFGPPARDVCYPGVMTLFTAPPASRPLPCRTSAAPVAPLLRPGGADRNTTASASASEGSASSSTGATSTPTSTDPTAVSGSSTDEPTAGSNSISGTGTTTETTVDPSTTTTTVSGTSSTGPDDTSTSNPVQTDTGTSSPAPDGTTTPGNGASSGGDDSSTTEDTTTGALACACPDLEVALDDGIFVLSDNSELYKFFPETNEFVELGAFNCGGMTNTFSMAVDRLGFAWVMFNTPQGEIWKLDVTNVGNCIDPGYNQGQMGINYFGMAFVSNSKFDQCDRIYGNTFNGFGGFSEGPNIGNFLTVDPDTLQVQTLGPTNFNGAEVTGTGDGRAFIFGGANPAKLVEVDKTNGKFLEITPLGNLELTNAFAFAFFAGDFYMFTESDGLFPLTSKVTHYDYDDSDMNGVKELTTVVDTAPIRIVGAGVSTCAPFVPL